MYKIIIALIILLDTSFLYLIPISDISNGIIGYYQKMGLSCFAILISLLLINKIFKKENKYIFQNNILVLFVMVLIQIVVSKLIYNQGFSALLSMSNQYILLILYFFFTYYISYKNNREKFENITIKFLLILSILMLVQYIIYIKTGNLFLSIKLGTRYGSIRVYESDYFFTFGAVLTFGLFLNRKNRLLNKKLLFFVFILCCIEVIFVSKSRMGLLVAILSCLFMIILKYRNNIIKKLGVLIACVVLFFVLMQIPSFNNAFSTINSNDSSLLTRGKAIEYYLSQFIEKPILGVGFIKPIENDESYYIVRGEQGKFYKEDLGIFSNVLTLGIIFIPWYLILVRKILKILLIIYRRGKEKNCLEIYGMFFAMILGSIVMNPFDPQRILVFTIFIAFMDNSYMKEKIT